MTEKEDPGNSVSIQDLLMSQVIELEALINVLEQKGILTKNEVFEEVLRVKAFMKKT